MNNSVNFIPPVDNSPFNETAIIEAAIDWCHLVGYDSTDEKVFTAFVMGAKLALSNDGWKKQIYEKV